MDNSLPQTSSSDVPQTLGTLSSNSGPPEVPPQQTEAPPSSSHVDAETVSTPIKRRPGRPKGSGKKSIGAMTGNDAADSAIKVKRPVGRPRKDGLPAGSLKGASASAVRTSRPRKSAPPKMGGEQGKQTVPTATGQVFGVSQPGPAFHPYYPPNAPYQTGFSAPVGMQPSAAPPMPSGNFHIDPNLDRDEWADLARTKPNTFLQSLVSSLTAPNPVSTAGPSVEEAFKSHLVSLAPNSASKEPQTIPSLYSILKTFWLPSSPAYFSLTASASTARTPSEHRFLYWDPQPLVFNGIFCPKCSVPLINRGRIRSGPIKIYDLEKPFFIVGCEYVCKSTVCVARTSFEGRKFASTDASILHSLPARLRDEFPVHLVQGDNDLGSGPNVWNWHAAGVSRSLWNMVRGCLQAGMPRGVILSVIKAIQFGVSEDDVGMEEEEGDDDSGQEGGEGSPEVTQRSASTTGQDANKNAATNAHNNAWEAQGAATDPNSTSGAAQASSSTLSVNPMTTIQTVQPAHQQFGFAQGGPYIAYPYQPYPYFTQQQPPSNSQIQTSQSGAPEQNALKRPFEYADVTPEVSILEPSQKRTRHCCKCGSQECKGKGGRSFCLNACQDCGKLECKGRNSRRPDKRCAEAWS